MANQQEQIRPTPPGRDRDPRLRIGPVEHLVRRCAFGVGPAERAAFGELTVGQAVDRLVDYDELPDQADAQIGMPGMVGVTVRAGGFLPNTSITDARQRWLFRMVHSQRPLQEKMALFWHNRFATAYSKVAGIYGSVEATRMMAAVPEEDPGRVRGQIETFRLLATGNFGDLVVAVAQDPAMLAWLDGRLNVKAKPQENFAREIMELFTMGVGFYTEPDVYAGARVFTGWNLQRVGASGDPAGRYTFVYNASQHDTSAKTFSFPIYADGSRTIPARSESAGMQDGLDFIAALAGHVETARQLARKLWGFFVSELAPPDPRLIDALADAYRAGRGEVKPVLRRLFTSPEFDEGAARFARYAWPVEFVVRALKEVGWGGFSVNDALAPLANMGQTLFEPPDVAGWDLGQGWFSSGPMLARMNFASTLARSQRAALARAAADAGARSPDELVHWAAQRLSIDPFDRTERDALVAYLLAGGAWTGSDAQLSSKVAGLVHLVAGSARYQFV